MLSLKKEIQKNSIDSLIPLTVRTGKSVDEAFKTAVIDLESSVNRFDNAADSLVANVKRDPHAGTSLWYYLRWVWPNQIFKSNKREADQDQKRALVRFLDASRQSCTGNLAWRYVNAGLCSS
jgi:hypothetical protein